MPLLNRARGSLERVRLRRGVANSRQSVARLASARVGGRKEIAVLALCRCGEARLLSFLVVSDKQYHTFQFVGVRVKRSTI